MIYTELRKDLFKLNNVTILAHYIAKDALMGVGIATEFKKRYPLMQKYVKKNQKNGFSCLIYEDDSNFYYENKPLVANLIAKVSSYRKPSYSNFKIAMEDFSQQVKKSDFKKIAMPLIGSGLDKLSWKNQVKPTILEIFGDMDVEIIVCYTNSNKHLMKK